MELRDVLLIGHILGVLVMAFGTGAGLLSMVSAGPRPDLATIARTARLGGLGGQVTAFAAIVVLIFGTWLIVDSEVYDFDQSWISAAYVLWFIAMGLGGGVMGRHERKLAAHADAAIARGETTNAEVLAEWNSPVTKAVGSILLLIYVVFLYLMVAKPGL